MNPAPFPWRLVGYLAALVALVVIPGLIVRSCDARHNQGAQAKVNSAQAAAMANSGADAVATVAAAGGNEAASEQLTRTNEQAIRAAPGAAAPVTPAVRDAGITALCKRLAYAHDPSCHRP